MSLFARLRMHWRYRHIAKWARPLVMEEHRRTQQRQRELFVRTRGASRRPGTSNHDLPPGWARMPDE